MNPPASGGREKPRASALLRGSDTIGQAPVVSA